MSHILSPGEPPAALRLAEPAVERGPVAIASAPWPQPARRRLLQRLADSISAANVAHVPFGPPVPPPDAVEAQEDAARHTAVFTRRVGV